MRRSRALLAIDRRVREMYLEFLVRTRELYAIKIPAKKCFFLRLEDTLPEGTPESERERWAGLRALLESTHGVTAVRSEAEAGGKAPHRAQSTVYAVHDAALLPRLDAYMPVNWRNNSAALEAGAAHPPGDTSVYRARVQQHFFENALLCPPGRGTEAREFKRALARGRYEMRKVDQLIHVRKYRAMHKRYGWASQLSDADLLMAWEGNELDVHYAKIGLGNKDTYGYDETEEEKAL